MRINKTTKWTVGLPYVEHQKNRCIKTHNLIIIRFFSLTNFNMCQTIENLTEELIQARSKRCTATKPTMAWRLLTISRVTRKRV